MTCLAPLLTNGLAPTLPAGLAQTQTMRNAAVGFQLAVKQKAIMLLDGPPGTGKTTTAAYLIGQAIDEGAPTVYVAIPERPSRPNSSVSSSRRSPVRPGKAANTTWKTRRGLYCKIRAG
ncbi:MAG: ATPase domain-containing protein [Candidatus Nanopelagicales bacterium]